MKGKTKTSEFGKGFIYNLILFAKHCEGIRERTQLYEGMRKKYPKLFSEDEAYQIWFNGASDHFYELEIPERFINTEIGNIAQDLKERTLYLGHGFMRKATKKDFDEVFKKLERLGMLIDKELGLEPIEAEWN